MDARKNLLRNAEPKFGKTIRTDGRSSDKKISLVELTSSIEMSQFNINDEYEKIAHMIHKYIKGNRLSITDCNKELPEILKNFSDAEKVNILYKVVGLLTTK